MLEQSNWDFTPYWSHSGILDCRTTEELASIRYFSLSDCGRVTEDSLLYILDAQMVFVHALRNKLAQAHNLTDCPPDEVKTKAVIRPLLAVKKY